MPSNRRISARPNGSSASASDVGTVHTGGARVNSANGRGLVRRRENERNAVHERVTEPKELISAPGAGPDQAQVVAGRPAEPEMQRGERGADLYLGEEGGVGE